MKKKLMVCALIFQFAFISTLLVNNLFNRSINYLSPKKSNLFNISSSSWSNATVISDDSTLWNNGTSYYPNIAVDSEGNIHVVWYDYTPGKWGTDAEIMYANRTASGWSNATVISDDSTLWNNGDSFYPSIAVDSEDNIHVAWQDSTPGEWGTDYEIMYANRTASGWSNATVISDDSTLWNTGNSYDPSLAVDSAGNIHVAWRDTTDGEWENDIEIMYAERTASGWSNATVISDDSTLWNTGTSFSPSLAVDNANNVHVVWEDYTPGEWGTDAEIMYANRTASGWSNATVISDDSTLWNNGSSNNPSITFDSKDNIHVAWEDYTPGAWGNDIEIMYANRTASGWSNATVISDDSTLWNNGVSKYPSIAVDNKDNIHVAWYDTTLGEWGNDIEIMYTERTASGWSNATVISDDSTLWNNGDSFYPSIAVDSTGNVHVAWQDSTDGEWGTDIEIMYTEWSSSIVKQPESPLWILLLGIQQPANFGLIIVGISVAVMIAIIIIAVKKRK
ncbi:MAG: hypothetical protein ACTSRG_14830 [Candidatus Helarchaeota archaeon]